MTTTADHYATHLGPIYTWMIGDLDAAFARSRTELDELPIPSSRGGIAVDLGAGFGLHSLPLAERGYVVTAIDTCEPLLNELRSRSAALPVKTVVGDLLAFRSFVRQPVDVILCMGDTLTHLPNFAAVESLLAGACAALRPGGIFTATFRDYASKALQHGDRFIPVRGDDDRILTCFLEYGDDRVTVYDLLNEKQQGRWLQRVSSYLKLRLAPEWIVGQLTELGLSVQRDTGIGGMTRVKAVKS
jgi:SAM-dependent methyltransferase